jgi:branched-chain amino acid transport system ATP-binding protein
MGLSQVPEGRHVFANMTVMENLDLGAYPRTDKEEINKDLTDVFTKFPRLLERKDQIAGTLSGGEQQMLAMGRALMSRPRLMLLDEPSMGLAPLLVQEIFNIIKEINDSGTTVLLVEQNARMALSIADKAYVLETGNITLEGTGKELLNSEAVQKAYLGG